MDLLRDINVIITNIFENMGFFAPIIACLLILIESMLPILPLAVFITINFVYMGIFTGFFVSWILTIIGCFISFKLCHGKLKRHFDNMLDKSEHKQLKRLMKVINQLKLEQLTLLVAIPFTPAFMVNIAAGLSNMDVKKFITSIIIGKVFLVYFWGFIGTSLIESFKEPKVLIEIGVFMLMAFIISKLINKKFRLE